MTTNIKLKEAYAVDAKYGAFYTGGHVEWHENLLYCQTEFSISKVDIDSGTVTSFVGEEPSENGDPIHTFTSNGDKVVTSHKSGLLKLWNSNNEIEKIWKYIHKGPIASLKLFGDVLASGGADGFVRLWDLVHHVCMAGLKGCVGVVNLLEFHPGEEDLIFASGDDGKIISWSGKEIALIYNAHFSKVTSLAINHDLKHFVSAGRDKVLILWRIGETSALKTIPVYEGIEAMLGMPIKFKLPDFKGNGGIYVVTGGENGYIRFWDMEKSKEVYRQNNSLVSKANEQGGLAITKLLIGKENKTIGIVSVEQNIIFHQLKSFIVSKQFIGFTDEILDVVFVGEEDSYIAVATNSNDIKLYESSTMNCSILKGHTDIVLALNKCPFDSSLLISSSKDNTIRVWKLKYDTAKCVGIGMRHTGSVGTVAFANSKRFAISASQDTTLKIWEIPENLTYNTPLISRSTEVAHPKDINCICVSPNDKIIATASQDKTAKLWSEDLTLLGVLKGHKRGVWCVRFSPVDQVLLTSSADCTLKIWSISDLSCLKTIEGHESSVIRAEFLSKGMQILSAGGDGLIKLFNLKTSECIKTFDEHESRIWALSVRNDENVFITGGSDSNLIKWKDVTEEERLKRLEEMEQVTLEEQQLSNYIQNDELLKALKLALKLQKPLNVLRIIQSVIKKGDTGLANAIRELTNEQKENLLKCVTEWNTNSKNCHPAQLVLNILIHELQSGNFRPVGLTGIIETTLPYTERHFKRVTEMMQDLHFINYTINCMQPYTKIE